MDNAFSRESTYQNQYIKYITERRARVSKNVSFRDTKEMSYEDFKINVDLTYKANLLEGKTEGNWKYNLWKDIERNQERYTTKSLQKLRKYLNENLFGKNNFGRYQSKELKEKLNKIGEINGMSAFTTTGGLRADFFLSYGDQIIQVIDELNALPAYWHKEIDT